MSSWTCLLRRSKFNIEAKLTTSANLRIPLVPDMATAIVNAFAPHRLATTTSFPARSAALQPSHVFFAAPSLNRRQSRSSLPGVPSQKLQTSLLGRQMPISSPEGSFCNGRPTARTDVRKAKVSMAVSGNQAGGDDTIPMMDDVEVACTPSGYEPGEAGFGALRTEKGLFPLRSVQVRNCSEVSM